MCETEPGEGQGFETFPLQDTKRGTRIIREEPLTSLRPDDNVLNIPAKYAKLSPELKTIYLGLRSNREEAGGSLRANVLMSRQQSFDPI